MRTNRVLDVIVAPYPTHTDVTLRRAGKTVRRVRGASNIKRVLKVLSEGAYTSTIQEAISPSTGLPYIVSITYKPMLLSEGKYREVLRAVYRFFHSNIDGLLEDNERAEYFWHLLGSISAYTYERWTPMKHREEFYKHIGESFKQAWESFFNDPRGA